MSLKTANFPTVLCARAIAHKQMEYYTQMMKAPNVQEELQKLLLRADDFFFFETAYQWRFKKRINLSGDITAWRVQQIVPSYVAEFILHIRPKTVTMATDYWKQQRGDADDDAEGF